MVTTSGLNHAFNGTRRYRPVNLANVGGGGPVDLVLLLGGTPLEGMMLVIRSPDHVTIAVANAAGRDRVLRAPWLPEAARRDDRCGPPARYMGMPNMKAQHITLVLEGAEPHFEIQLLEFDPKPRTTQASIQRICGDGATTSCVPRRRIGRPPGHLTA